MVTLDKAVIAKLDKNGKHFEILVDANLAYAYKEGKSVSLASMLAVNHIFSDASKGTKSPESDLKVFGTDDPFAVAEEVLKKGEIQLTTEFRRKKAEEKRLQIASIISKNAINPQTKLPHPQQRIENAMEQAKINVDPLVPADQQIPSIIAALRPILPISFETADVEVMIPARYASRAFGVMKTMGDIVSQKWMQDGSLAVKIKIPAGMKQDILGKINSLSGGSAVFK
ncbi:MAG: ribosome assembly factor SBDS [Candidatus Aenigmarchaeota archaeon]|nr:ribosome assembly factor SBDS [Candidatus Aenigmarchaeota archaeon]